MIVCEFLCALCPMKSLSYRSIKWTEVKHDTVGVQETCCCMLHIAFDTAKDRTLNTAHFRVAFALLLASLFVSFVCLTVREQKDGGEGK
jgi:hypothetical protein